VSKRDLLIFLFKWKAGILGMFFVVLAAAALIIFFAPPSYSASAKVLVERTRPPVLRTTLAPAMDLAEALNTEAEILVSRTVMSQVVDKLKPHERPRKPSSISRTVDATRAWMEQAGLLYAQSPRERWIQLLQKNMKVKPSIDSSILKVSFGDEDPQWAARLVNAVLDEYVVQHVRMFSTHGTAPIYLERMQAIEADLRRRRSDLEQLKRRLSLTAIEDTKRDLVRRNGDLAGQMQTAQTTVDTLLLRFEPAHREVVLAKATLARLARASEQVGEQLTRLESQQAKLDETQLEIGSLESAYKDYARRYDDARLTDLASANAINVGAVDHADVPERPDNSRLFLLLVAAGGGLVFAVLVAVVREYFDRRLADPTAAEDILGIPDLGSVAFIAHGRLARLSGRSSG